MSNLRVFDPLFSDNFDTALRRMFSPAHADPEVQLKMRIDVAENDKGYAVEAEIPGVKKEDISVRIDGNVVRIDAQTRKEKEERGDGDKILRSERYYGTISRSFSLADDIDESKVDARYADGVLKLQLPKKEATPSRKITVQ